MCTDVYFKNSVNMPVCIPGYHTVVRMLTMSHSWCSLWISSGFWAGAQDWQNHSKRDGSEDCLYLNVYVPSDANHTSKLPCFLWIHGGGYEYGASNDYNADASKLVTDWCFEICVMFICIIFSFLFGMIIPYNVPPSHKLVYKPINYSL